MASISCPTNFYYSVLFFAFEHIVYNIEIVLRVALKKDAYWLELISRRVIGLLLKQKFTFLVRKADRGGISGYEQMSANDNLINNVSMNLTKKK